MSGAPLVPAADSGEAAGRFETGPYSAIVRMRCLPAANEKGRRLIPATSSILFT
jgi:hypothetical protein